MSGDVKSNFVRAPAGMRECTSSASEAGPGEEADAEHGEAAGAAVGLVQVPGGGGGGGGIADEGGAAEGVPNIVGAVGEVVEVGVQDPGGGSVGAGGGAAIDAVPRGR